MKRIFILAAILFVLAGAASAQLYTFLPIYTITGTVSDTPEAFAEGNMVVFYKDTTELGSGIYAYDYVGTAGTAGLFNKYMINVFSLPTYTLDVGKSYYVAVVQDANGYGAGPVQVVISGKGYDVAPAMGMAYGAGVAPPPPQGVLVQAPIIEEIWIGNRLYQKTLVAKGEQFIASPNPKIIVKVKATGTSGIDPNNVQIVKGAKTYTATAADIVSKTAYIAAPTVLQSLSVAFTIPKEDPLAEGTTDLTFRAYDATGTASAKEVASVTVVGGEPRVIGVPIVYPSPVHLKTDRQVTFQYTLSHDVNVDIYLFDVSARIVKKLMYNREQEGGSAGINKVDWNLITDQGTLISSGIYVFTIVDRETGKLLGRGKFTALP